MISVSTKKGDKGTTTLIEGQRLDKDELVFEVIGNLDELNSWLGLIVASLDSNFPQVKKFLLKVQNNLFYMGAEFAGSTKTKLQKTDLEELEKVADGLQHVMDANWHTKFLLPGGTVLGSYTDIARTVCRRTERAAVAYTKTNKISPTLIKYLNRLSDYLYILRCYFNQRLEYTEHPFVA